MYLPSLAPTATLSGIARQDPAFVASITFDPLDHDRPKRRRSLLTKWSIQHLQLRQLYIMAGFVCYQVEHIETGDISSGWYQSVLREVHTTSRPSSDTWLDRRS